MDFFGTILLISFLIVIFIITALYTKKHHKKYLIFSSVGDRNNIHTWTSAPDKKNFDLVLYYFGDKANPQFEADLIVNRKGLKFENFYHFLIHNDISQYDSIWVVDDDIIMDTSSINKMFQIFSEYKLQIAQPSFDNNSLISHTCTKNKPNCILHYTNFVENNVVIFSTEVIPLLKSTFKDAKTGFGVDFIWTDILKYPTNKIAVIDAVSCCHPITDYSALDAVVPRYLHKFQGAELLSKYGLLDSDWQPTELNPWPTPYKIVEYSVIRNPNNLIN